MPISFFFGGTFLGANMLTHSLHDGFHPRNGKKIVVVGQAILDDGSDPKKSWGIDMEISSAKYGQQEMIIQKETTGIQPARIAEQVD